MIDREQYSDAREYVRAQIRHRRRMAALRAALLLLILSAAAAFFVAYFKVRSVTVEGSSKYTKDEISSMVMTGPLGDNSVLLSLRYRDKPIRNIPFIETMKVQVVTHDSIRIRVYEKTIAGYVNYLGSCMYFDRDGIVVESSKEELKDVPEVTGLKFQSIVLYKKLPAENDEVFDRILTVTQLLSKYGLHADRIYFSTTSSMSLYFGDVRADLGEDQYTDEKISNLRKILPSLKNKKGTVDLVNYTPDTSYITFREKGS
ncbi:MAG TPA: cell division protein FtsQ [Lachnospiraceae bacterium]|nr:cell division protein FtsQ [Lachnospiraceae bacterium]HBH70622.1 cell division protein FtsQ [Lachnospiraceae bacterium]